jgi:type IV fimbrial biogenesis protein FimT
MKRSAQEGFTLWELLVTLVVVGIVFSFGVPNFMEFQRNGAITSAANTFVTGTLAARTEAVKRQVPVTLCLSDDATAPNPTCLPGAVADSLTRGFVVWVDENGDVDANGIPDLTDATDGNGVIDAGERLLMRGAAPGGTIRTSANCGHVSYGPNGFPRAIAGACAPNNRTFLFCDDRGNRVAAGQLSTARVVRIDPPGRGQVLHELADVGAAIASPVELAPINPTCPAG